ncbi:hypothetical protein M9H77_27593 [Catharanthus roseus]|uniref:Uncharacterized protein n=1 Tax=Catharanthus roseus TaxID=4058 RepID=A0ACC0AEK3_CATRO|nr:hypothetical protein M9H77_27593 [Catharanthus roseus]
MIRTYFLEIKTIYKENFPIWFYEWWINFGSLPDILPPIPKLGFQTWVKKMTGPAYAIPLQFYAELRVPWIFCWSYKIDRVYSKEFPMSLIREFKIKWWTAYSVELCSQEAVLQFLQNRHLIQRSIQQLSKGASSSAQTPAPATPSPLKQESSTSKIITIAADDTDEAAQFQEFLRFKAFQQQMKRQSTHSPTSSQDSSTEPLVYSIFQSLPTLRDKTFIQQDIFKFYFKFQESISTRLHKGVPGKVVPLVPRRIALGTSHDFYALEMANFVRKMFSSSSHPHSRHIIHSKEEHIQYNFNDWTIPEEQIETIYKIGTFDFKTAFSVKTHEETMNIQEKFQTTPLLSKTSLNKYLEKGFRYIHYGLIQVAVKPLVHIGVDAPIYLALRDKRLKRYKPSLLAMIQTNICNGPIYFNCAPNYSVSLTDPLIMNSLVLDIHLQGDEFEKLTEQFVVMYRVYYRLLSSQLNPRFKLIPISRDETVLLHIEAEQSKIFTPKRLKWHEITIPEEFQIENAQLPPHLEKTEISQIIEEPNGNILIRFNSMREWGSSSNIPIESSRHSFAHPQRRSFTEASEQSFRIPNSNHVHHTAPIPEV